MSEFGNAVIEVDQLVKSYDGFHAVDGLSLSVRSGEIFGLLGPNGAGKTTTIECIVGLRKPTTGTVRVLGMDPASDRKRFTARVAVQPQSASLFEHLTVLETLRLFASFHSNPRSVDEIMDQIGLVESAAVRSSRLSGGQLRRLLLGVALVGAPEIIVLDEPSAGLDPAARQSLWQLIRDLRDAGTTVLLSTHHMDEASELCDRVGIVVAGELAEVGTPNELVLKFSRLSTLTFFVTLETSTERIRTLVNAPDAEIVTHAERLEVHVQTDDPDEAIRKLTFATDVKASGFSVVRGSLEKVFLEVSGDQDSRKGTTAKARQRS